MKILKEYAKANKITLKFDTMPLKYTNSPGYVSSVDIKGTKYGGGGTFVWFFTVFTLNSGGFLIRENTGVYRYFFVSILLHIIYYNMYLVTIEKILWQILIIIRNS